MVDRFQAVAQLIGDKARASMLWHLLEGKALTATELAMCADVSPQSASMHLHRLVSAGLLAMEKQGRHRYFRFSGPEAAYAVEALANLVPADKPARDTRLETGSGIRYCRTCYDHLAGYVAVGLTEQFLKQKIMVRDASGFALTQKGRRWFDGLEIDVPSLKTTRRIFARACLDWSERKHHLAGALGAALLETMLASDWIRRTRHSRLVVVTSLGQRRIYDLLGVRV